MKINKRGVLAEPPLRNTTHAPFFEKRSEVLEKMTKKEVVQKERVKLLDIFNDIDEKQKLLTESLIDDAAFLVGENFVLKQSLEKTGMVKMHPDHPDIQKTVPASAQYLKNLNAYTIVVKTLSTILNRQATNDDDDDLEEFE